MSREKQIEEMANILWHIPNNYYYYLNSYNDCKRIAECIYDDGGYRKQSEVAKEIFDEIENNKRFIQDHAGNIGIVVTLQDITELKKKYTESEELE